MLDKHSLASAPVRIFAPCRGCFEIASQSAPICGGRGSPHACRALSRLKAAGGCSGCWPLALLQPLARPLSAKATGPGPGPGQPHRCQQRLSPNCAQISQSPSTRRLSRPGTPIARSRHPRPCPGGRNTPLRPWPGRPIRSRSPCRTCPDARPGNRFCRA